jgi:uncharacterized membrane protein
VKRAVEIPPFLQRALRFVPAAVLTAVVIPSCGALVKVFSALASVVVASPRATRFRAPTLTDVNLVSWVALWVMARVDASRVGHGDRGGPPRPGAGRLASVRVDHQAPPRVVPPFGWTT